jgi:hypothetical protein
MIASPIRASIRLLVAIQVAGCAIARVDGSMPSAFPKKDRER